MQSVEFHYEVNPTPTGFDNFAAVNPRDHRLAGGEYTAMNSPYLCFGVRDWPGGWSVTAQVQN